MMSCEGADQGCRGRGDNCGNHGNEPRVGNALIGSKANGERATARNESASGMPRENAGEETNRNGS
jgi:hypothetical protein